jgi:hypothetical protein
VKGAALLIASGSLFLFTSVSEQAPQQAVNGSAVIWRDPGAIEQRDTLWGPASEERKPVPPFTFLREKLTGVTAKVVVKDASNREWDVKLGVEAHSETAASRLLWALGFMTQEMYYVPEGTISGANGLQRAQKYVKADGHFSQARFRVRDPNIAEGGTWSFTENPFTGTKELSGLILLMALINNWDTADHTNKEIELVSTNGSQAQHYTVPDLGASFGRFVGPQGTPIKWHLDSFKQDRLVKRVDAGNVLIDYAAYGHPPQSVPLDHARWFADLAGRLQESQLRRAFEAAGATPEETIGFSAKMLEKIGELRAAVNSTR